MTYSQPTAEREPSRQKKAGWVRWVNPVLWVLCPVLTLTVLEHRTIEVADWYREAGQDAQEGPVTAVFVGSSRTAAAVSTHAFEEHVRRETGKKVRVTNMGQGWTTLKGHCLGLRSLWQANPEHMRGCTVFVEVTEGLPELSPRAGSWVNKRVPEKILPYLRSSDLPKLWNSRTPFECKLQLTLGYGMKGSRFWEHRKIRGYKTLTSAKDLATSALDRWRRASLDEADLTSKGGIRTDVASLGRIRRQARALAKAARQTPRPTVGDWEDQEIAELVHMVRSFGGRVILFNVPLSSVEALRFTTPPRRQAARTFRQQAQQWNMSILTPEFPSDDSDFPDLMHLRHSRSAEYSTALAQSWVAFLKAREEEESP